ncbi:hypothetical protein [Herbihabitans rhizosphaerae]|uniref:hypothetical protein n=1 Tax=Herbihabitans rhizosphaerae TaxID=1872711 RepID=UPI00102C14FB|nr:hypothetical protein [Herbihabitans rhizosphaerae]
MEAGDRPDSVVPQQEKPSRVRHVVGRKIVTAVKVIGANDHVARARSVLGYRLRKAPRDVLRLLWFFVRGVGRWIATGWRWASYADLRSDARAARLAGDVEARRTAQELIRADAKARWAKAGLFLRRTVITTAVVIVLVVLLALMEMVFDRAGMPGWLQAVYDVRDAIGTAVAAVWPWLPTIGLLSMLVAAVWEGRDRTPGAGWLTRPDRDDADSWVDERMISKALAHLGIAPLNAFFKDGGELVYTVPARKDGDGTYTQVRLPLGVTAAMVADRRRVLAANLGRASLETWPTTGAEESLLDLWIADKGTLSGGAGDWPLLTEGTVDLFNGVPFGLSQRGVIINAPLIESNWLIGGRPGQGKTSAMRVLMLGACLDPTVEAWAYILGESPDFAPLKPRLARYRMGLDDSVVADAVQALEDLLKEMERRGKVLSAQPGQPPKVSRKLADRPGLGLHPIVLGIDECHELFMHPRYGKLAAELCVRLIKRGRKYGIILLLATQSPTRDSIPKEITRNVSVGVAYSVADHVANDGLLGAGRYRAGVRATELRTKTDRGTCVAVGVSDSAWELVRSYYVAYEDGRDDVTMIVARAMAALAEHGRTVAATDPTGEIEAAPVDHLADIAHVINGEPRLRTQTVLSRLAGHNPGEYEPWTARDLRAVIREHGIRPRKVRGHWYLYPNDVAHAITRRAAHHEDDTAGDAAGEARGNGGTFPTTIPQPNPPLDLGKPRRGTQNGAAADDPENPGNPGSDGTADGSLPRGGGGDQQTP